MRKHLKKWILAVITLVILFFAIVLTIGIYKSQHTNRQAIFAKNGILDLSSISLEHYGVVKLDGEWEFYPNRLIMPEELSQERNTDNRGYVKVPMAWDKYKGRNKMPEMGTATYRLRVKLKNSDLQMGIKTNSIRMSSRIYVDGYEVLSVGNPAEAKNKGYVMNNTPYTTFFHPKSKEMVIVVQVANFDYRAGGIVQSIYLGKGKSIHEMSVKNNFLNTFLTVALLLTGIYYLFVYIDRRKDISVLYYSAYAISFSAFEMLYGEKVLLQMFVSIANQYYWVIKIQNVILNLTIILVCFFIGKITKRAIPVWFTKTVLIFYGTYSVAFLILPLEIIWKVQNFTLITGMGVYAFVISAIVRALIIKKYSDLSSSELIRLCIAFICVLIYFIDGTLYLNNLKSNNYIGYISMTIFILNVALLISQQYNKSYRIVETVNSRLLELDRLKDEFLQNTSHELRTPLNGIINLTHSVIDRAGEGLPQMQREDLKLVITAGKRLNNLINDILDMSCLRRGEIKLYKKTSRYKGNSFGDNSHNGESERGQESGIYKFYPRGIACSLSRRRKN
jgi:two-component system sensor histidine kinase ChiS